MNKELAAKAYDLLAEGYATLALAARGGTQTAPTASPQSVAKPPAGTPVAEAGGDRCIIHGQPWKVVPAGVSGPKSKHPGTPFSAFATCPERGCKERPSQAWYDEHGMAA